jgi:hypothetical protein
MGHVNLRGNTDSFKLSARSETLFPMLPTDWLWLFADKLRQAAGQCFLAVNLKGQTHRKVGTQSLRSAGSPEPEDSGVAGKLALIARP